MITAFVDGAVITRPSRVMANWFAGLCRPKSLEVTKPKASEPAPSNSKLTAQVLVLAPVWVVTVPALASEMFAPCTSTGPRMYLYSENSSQVTRPTIGSSTCPAPLKGKEQSKFSN